LNPQQHPWQNSLLQKRVLFKIWKKKCVL
jgi:hypothetical protein